MALKRKFEQPTEHADVTPDTARLWLERVRSRLVQPTVVERYAMEMKEGRWADNHPDPVMFDREKHLINGQHRLHAIVRSGATVRMLVMRNMDPDLAHVIDVGRSRTVSDSIVIHHGEAVPKRVTQAVPRFIAGCYLDQTQNLPYTRLEIAAFFTKYATELIAVHNFNWGATRRGFFRTAVFAAIARAYATKPGRHDRLEQFVRVLTSGRYDGVEDYDGPFKLREYLLDLPDHSRNGQARDVIIYKKAESALVAFLQHQPLKQLGILKSEQFKLEEDKYLED